MSILIKIIFIKIREKTITALAPCHSSFNEDAHYAVRFAEPLIKAVLSKAKMMRLVKYIQTPPSASFYDTWNVLQHPNLYFSAIQRMMWFGGVPQAPSQKSMACQKSEHGVGLI